jgi:pimeloyl-ACP methyl ester carboxylesterase
MAQDTLTVMHAAAIESAHFIGHSLGGAVALQIALSAPHKVRSLALLCTSARGSDATRLTSRMIWLGLRSRIGTRRMRSSAFLEIVMPAGYLSFYILAGRYMEICRICDVFRHLVCLALYQGTTSVVP